MVSPHNFIHIYSLWYGNMPDIYTALMFLLYTITESSWSWCPLRFSPTLIYYWFPRCVQSCLFLSPCTISSPSNPICLPRHAAACTIHCRYIPRSLCLYQTFMQSPSLGILQGYHCKIPPPITWAAWYHIPFPYDMRESITLGDKQIWSVLL